MNGRQLHQLHFRDCLRRGVEALPTFGPVPPFKAAVLLLPQL